MAARSIASLSLSFGLVSIPVKLYSATEPSAGVRFNLLARDGSRLKQQYISERTGQVVERADMVRGYEFEKDRFVLFTNDELKALQEAPSQSIDIVSFVPLQAVDPLYYDKAYFLAPDKRGGKPYALLVEAMRSSGRCALARWAWRGKQYIVQVRPEENGIVLQQLLYADEVRSIRDLDIEAAPVAQGELKLARQLIDQISTDHYDPAAYQDEEKQRIVAAIDRKIEGSEVVVREGEAPSGGAQVIDLMAALKASVSARGGKTAAGSPAPARARSDSVVTAEAGTAARRPARAGRSKAPVDAALEDVGSRNAASKDKSSKEATSKEAISKEAALNEAAAPLKATARKGAKRGTSTGSSRGQSRAAR